MNVQSPGDRYRRRQGVVGSAWVPRRPAKPGAAERGPKLTSGQVPAATRGPRGSLSQGSPSVPAPAVAVTDVSRHHAASPGVEQSPPRTSTVEAG